MSKRSIKKVQASLDWTEKQSLAVFVKSMEQSGVAVAVPVKFDDKAWVGELLARPAGKLEVGHD